MNAKCHGKIWFEARVEHGEDIGKVCVLTHALYGLKSARASWCAELVSVLQDLGYKLTKADLDIWIRVAVTDSRHEYYEMLFVYVDNILSLSHKPHEAIDEIAMFFKPKEGSIKEPNIFLGGDVGKTQLPDGHEVWTTSPRTYVVNSIKVVECLFVEDGKGYSLKNKVKNPFPTGYQPELDISEELGPDLALRFMQLISILRWAVKLGRINIFFEVSSLSQYQVCPRLGHLEAAYRIFAYLKNHPNRGWIAYDPKALMINEEVFNNSVDWTDFYVEVEEELPANMPKPRGNLVTISAFIDANHARNKITHHLHTGILIFVQNAPIIWFSKRQNMVEISTFGSELVACRICKELIVALRYKLQMFGIPIDGLVNVFCDNQGVVKNPSVPESTLMKKHNAINYHAVREAVAAGILCWEGRYDDKFGQYVDEGYDE